MLLVVLGRLGVALVDVADGQEVAVVARRPGRRPSPGRRRRSGRAGAGRSWPGSRRPSSGRRGRPGAAAAGLAAETRRNSRRLVRADGHGAGSVGRVCGAGEVPPRSGVGGLRVEDKPSRPGPQARRSPRAGFKPARVLTRPNPPDFPLECGILVRGSARRYDAGEACSEPRPVLDTTCVSNRGVDRDAKSAWRVALGVGDGRGGGGGDGRGRGAVQDPAPATQPAPAPQPAPGDAAKEKDAAKPKSAPAPGKTKRGGLRAPGGAPPKGARRGSDPIANAAGAAPADPGPRGASTPRCAMP